MIGKSAKILIMYHRTQACEWLSRQNTGNVPFSVVKLYHDPKVHWQRIWTPERTDFNKSTELKGHSGGVDQLRWDPHSPERLVTASTDATVRFWDIRQGKATHVIPTQGQNINMAISPDGKMVVVGDRRDVITFIDAGTGKIIETMTDRQLAPKGIEVRTLF